MDDSVGPRCAVATPFFGDKCGVQDLRILGRTKAVHILLLPAAMCDCPFFKIVSTWTLDQQKELYRGAFIQYNDRGRMYKQMIESPCGAPSCSSHRSSRPQYRCEEMGVVLLFSRNTQGTWLQLESHSPYHSPICHCFSWLYYKTTGVNSGPDGHSCYTEQAPLVIKRT